MDIERLKFMAEDDRASVLQSESLDKEEQLYIKPLSPDEIREYKDRLAQTSIEIGEIEAELKAIKTQYKARLDPLKAQLKMEVDAVKTGTAAETGMVWFMPDYESFKVVYVVADGTIVSSRAMRSEERQLKFD